MTQSTARRATAQETVLAALRADVVSGHLRPGEQVVQETLAERYGVSRVPLREALKILEGEGLVTYHPHRGYFVAELSMDDLREAYRIRELLESEALDAALSRLSADDLDRVEGLAVEVEAAMAAGDVLAITDANRRFHFAIFEASAMPRLVRLLRQLWDATDVYRGVLFADAGNRAAIAREHRAIVAALRARDATALVQAQDRHRDRTVSALRGGIG